MTDVVLEGNRAGDGAPGGRAGNGGDGLEGGIGNQGGQGGSGGDGGGLYAMYSLALTNGVIRANRAGNGADGGAAGDGGAPAWAGPARATTSSRERAEAEPGSVSVVGTWTSP